MYRCVIVADDLTGLQATSAEFSFEGFRVRTFLDWKSEIPPDSKLDVIGINTGTRSSSPGEAYARVRAIAERMRKAEIGLIFKQNDSTLKGNLGAELQALHDVYRSPPMLCCLACPSDGRITSSGFQLMDGIVLNPNAKLTRPSRVSEWVKANSTLEVQDMGLDLIAVSDAAQLLQRIDLDVAFTDALFDSHLDVIAESALKAGCRIVVGSKGLAKAIARTLGRTRSHSPILLVIGSQTNKTRRQIRVLSEHQLAATVQVDLRMLAVRPEADEMREYIDSVSRRVHSVIISGQNCLLSVGSTAANGSMASLTDDVPMSETLARRMTNCLAMVTKAVLELVGSTLAGVVLSGGDTAEAVLRHAFEATSLELVEEVFPAGVIQAPCDGRFPGMLVLTKSGNWGPEDALSAALQALTWHARSNQLYMYRATARG